MSTQHQSDIAVMEKLKEPSKYKVIIHDNPQTSYEEVIFVVSRAFEKTEAEALAIAHRVNFQGKGVCGVYTKEIAESKLVAVGMLKDYLCTQAPHREKEINMLKFTLEQE